MSEPFIKVWAGDMRADPKIAELNRRYPGGAYLLIQLWDLAKNGPGEPDELLGPDERPMRAGTILTLTGLPTEDDYDVEETPLDVWDGQRVRECLDAIVELGLGELGVTGALRFSALRKRQGIDATNAARQARFRERQKARSNASNGTVTPRARERVRANSREPEPELEARSTATVEEGRKQHAPAEHGDGTDQEHPTPPELPPQLVRLLDDQIIHELKPGQVQLVAAAWEHGDVELRHSIADIERADKPVAALVAIAKRIAPTIDADTPTTTEKRQTAIATCRRLYTTAIDDGDTPTTARAWLENEYRHDPAIVTEAIGPPTLAATTSQGDVAI